MVCGLVACGVVVCGGSGAQAIFVQTALLWRTVEGFLVSLLPSQPWRNATQGMVFCPNPFQVDTMWLAGHVHSSCTGLASAVALFEPWVCSVANNFGVLRHTNSPKVASRQCTSSQSRRSEGRSARLRGGSGAAIGSEGGPTCCPRTPTYGSSGRESGVHQTVTGQVGLIGTGTSQRTERVGRRTGPHGEVPRGDDPGSSCRTTTSRVRNDSTSHGPPEIERLKSLVAEIWKKRFRSLSVPSPDLVGGPDVSLQEWGALHDERVGRSKGAIMETLISRGSTWAANSDRFSPLA